MSMAEADAKARLFSLCPPHHSARAWFVPGRIELLGKHTDYAGGRSLLCAVERGFCVVSAPRADDRICLLDARTGSRAGFLIEGAPINGEPPAWARYPAAVALRLRAGGLLGHGADVSFASDLPSAAGMSSSSAFVVASYLALCDAIAPQGRESLAAWLAAAEAGVGTHGGSEDHTAILCCRAGHWSQYRFCPPQCEQTIPAPPHLCLVIAVSGVTASKSGAARDAYNRTADSTREILALWNQASARRDSTVAAALAAAGFEPMAALLPPPLRARLEQFHNESEVWIPAAVRSAAAGDWQHFGACVAHSQAAAESALANQIPETIALAASARRLGALAASSFGAGFGGSVWALMPRAQAPAFRAAWQRAYLDAFAARAAESLFFESAAGPAALPITLET